MAFQFHEGPIKAHGHAESPAELFQFQFHEGPIKAEVDGVLACLAVVSIP